MDNLSEGREMSTVVKFLILYLLPVVSFAGVGGIYLLAYGKSLDSPLIDLALLIVVAAFIASSYLTVLLISQFLANEVIYLGIICSILGWLLVLIPVVFYLAIFKDVFSP